ncbi:MAG: polysaccharide pyruvyl transferase family protein [Halanaerobiales bacterium]|nr:polysaccharide pyruvyl transferase family protein [Halanaerobiales bacterium]
MKKKNVLYYHAGSGNHGCEALVRSIIDICKLKDVDLYSTIPTEDEKFCISEIVDNIYALKFTAEEIKNVDEVKVGCSIGGDNCSNPYTASVLEKYRRKFENSGAKTFFVGCSIGEDVFTSQEAIDSLKQYDAISARESITYNNLIERGVNAYLIPDSAFVLPIEEVEPFKKETIGINASGLIRNKIMFDNFVRLIRYILEDTKYDIALIPHVAQPCNDDLKVLKDLYDMFDSDRIKLIEDNNCMKLKGYIANCKMLVCNRTHASIAGYSSLVPTLVLGYSIKSKGIAIDLFGTDKNYVISVHDLKTSDDLAAGFKWLENNYYQTKEILINIMPDYKNRCYDIKEIYENLCVQE